MRRAPSCWNKLPWPGTETTPYRGRFSLFERQHAKIDKLMRPNAEQFDLNQPPYEAAFKRTPNGFIATALTSSGEAWLRVPLAIGWTSLTLFWAYGAAVQHGRQMAVFAVPFLGVAGWLIALAAMRVCGRVEVAKTGADGRIFAGVRKLGWSWNFHWADARSAEQFVFPARGRRPEKRCIALSMQNGSVVYFGTMLDDTARGYLTAAIHEGIREFARQQQPAPQTNPG